MNRAKKRNFNKIISRKRLKDPVKRLESDLVKICQQVLKVEKIETSEDLLIYISRQATVDKLAFKINEVLGVKISIEFFAKERITIKDLIFEIKNIVFKRRMRELRQTTKILSRFTPRNPKDIYLTGTISNKKAEKSHEKTLGGVPFTGIHDWLVKHNTKYCDFDKLQIINKIIDLNLLKYTFYDLLKFYPKLRLILVAKEGKNRIEKVVKRGEDLKEYVRIINIAKYSHEVQESIIEKIFGKIQTKINSHEIKIAIFFTGRDYRVIFCRDIVTINNKLFTEILKNIQYLYNLKLIGHKTPKNLKDRRIYTPICSYPDYHSCLYPNILEKICWENRGFFYKSLMPALDFSCLPNYYIVDDKTRRNLDLNAWALGYKKVLNFLDRLSIDFQILSFKNKEKAIDYYNKNISDNKILLLVGSVKNLPFFKSYYKNNNLKFRSLDLAQPTISIFSASFNHDPLCYSAHGSFWSQIDKKKFLKYWQGEKKQYSIFGKDKYQSPNFLNFQIFKIENINEIKSHEVKMLYQALALNINEFFSSKIISDNKAHGFKAYFGRQVIEMYKKDVIGNLAKKKDALSDIMIIDLIIPLKCPYLFLRDLLHDTCLSNNIFVSDLDKITQISNKWNAIFDELFIKLREKNISYWPSWSFLPKSTLFKYKFLSERSKIQLIRILDEISLMQNDVFTSMQEKLKKLQF